MRETKKARMRRIAYALRESFAGVAPEPTLTISIQAWEQLAWQAYAPRISDEDIAMRAIDAIFPNHRRRGNV